jgi:hypothetical protein
MLLIRSAMIPSHADNFCDLIWLRTKAQAEIWPTALLRAMRTNMTRQARHRENELEPGLDVH